MTLMNLIEWLQVTIGGQKEKSVRAPVMQPEDVHSEGESSLTSELDFSQTQAAVAKETRTQGVLDFLN